MDKKQIIIQPNGRNGLVRGLNSMQPFDLMTENSDSGQTFTVCTRVVKLENDISNCL